MDLYLDSPVRLYSMHRDIASPVSPSTFTLLQYPHESRMFLRNVGTPVPNYCQWYHNAQDSNHKIKISLGIYFNLYESCNVRTDISCQFLLYAKCKVRINADYTDVITGNSQHVDCLRRLQIVGCSFWRWLVDILIGLMCWYDWRVS